MECSVCNTRSQVDSCVQCHTLLCEVCGETCEKCGEMACPDHTKRTSSGHILCFKCYERRRAKKEARRQAAEASGGTGFQNLSDAPKHPSTDDTERIEHAALTKSAQSNWPPHKLSMFAGVAGLIMVLVILFIPEFRRIGLAGGSYLPTSLFVIILSAISGLWAAIGLMSKDEEAIQKRSNCFIGAGVAVFAAILAVVAIVTDPASIQEERARQAEEQQREQTGAERTRETQDILNDFR